MKKSYWLLLALPYLAMILGIAFNQIAVHANGGHMPVLFPGHECIVKALKGDVVHTCMTQATHFKILCDWFISSNAVYSIGDHLLEFAADVKIPSMIVWLGLMAKDIFKK